jgi:crotonobetainyl-CoA hydratase
MDEALVLAERIAENAPLAVRYSKAVMLQSLGAGDTEGWRLTDEAVGVVFSSSDAMEGPVAFAEKRRPNWQGR